MKLNEMNQKEEKKCYYINLFSQNDEQSLYLW